MATVAGLPVVGSLTALDEAFSGMPRAEGDESLPGFDAYRVSLPTFEGPLDLLLHLIRRDQINIYDIPIAQICASYLEYLGLMQTPDVNVAGEFMVMASTLMYLKSVMLLPVEKENEDDPRAPLVAQLLEYEKFQRASKVLDARSWLGRDTFARPEGATKDLMPLEALAGAPIDPIEAFSLLVALKSCLERTTRPPIQIFTDPTSLREKVAEITQALIQTSVVPLRNFFPEQPSKHHIIVAFLAMLELARLKFIEIIQPEILGPIQIRRVRPFDELNTSLLEQY